MKKIVFFRLLVLGSLFLTHSAFCQTNVKELTLEDIYKNNLYESKGFGSIRWMKDNAGYSTLETNPSTNDNRSYIFQSHEAVCNFTRAVYFGNRACRNDNWVCRHTHD